MNKTQLVDALAERLGDRRTAASAVDGLLETIVETVRSGDSVSLTGFGVFEGRARAARTARNPRTGETVDVPATTVPAFRPGATFRSAVGGNTTRAPRSAPARPRPARTAKASASFAAPPPASAPGTSAATTAPKAKAASPKASPKSGKAEKQAKADKPAKAKAVAPAKGGDKGAKADKGKKAKAKK